ncbi:hypothetical protein H4219_000927 [Mycoemilia scoparia]|uniref:Uncharacterized protein n=1 Tax=Mycoemilia scoparia TaxID=417184 RepID=A0A9W8A7D2_9FUNG|nr:hypothetical protein H4219_000927 [Mycoemilia scoparia]
MNNKHALKTEPNTEAETMGLFNLVTTASGISAPMNERTHGQVDSVYICRDNSIDGSIASPGESSAADQILVSDVSFPMLPAVGHHQSVPYSSMNSYGLVNGQLDSLLHNKDGPCAAPSENSLGNQNPCSHTSNIGMISLQPQRTNSSDGIQKYSNNQYANVNGGSKVPNSGMVDYDFPNSQAIHGGSIMCGIPNSNDGSGSHTYPHINGSPMQIIGSEANGVVQFTGVMPTVTLDGYQKNERLHKRPRPTKLGEDGFLKVIRKNAATSFKTKKRKQRDNSRDGMRTQLENIGASPTHVMFSAQPHPGIIMSQTDQSLYLGHHGQHIPAFNNFSGSFSSESEPSMFNIQNGRMNMENNPSINNEWINSSGAPSFPQGQ